MTNPLLESELGRTRATTYRIRVAGALDEEWFRRAQGMTVSVQHSESEGSHTELIGELSDEAALMGVLEALYDHGARLLSVERVEEDRSTSARQGDAP
jgi:hypothetical protein